MRERYTVQTNSRPSSQSFQSFWSYMPTGMTGNANRQPVLIVYTLIYYIYIRGRGFRAVSSEGMKFMTEMTGMTDDHTPLFPYFPHPSNMFFPHNFRHKNCTRRQFQKCAKMTFQTRKCIIQTPKCIFQRKSLPFHLPMCYTYPIKSKERRNLILWIFFPRSSWTTRLP